LKARSDTVPPLDEKGDTVDCAVNIDTVMQLARTNYEVADDTDRPGDATAEQPDGFGRPAGTARSASSTAAARS
jgi:hypothetical protein